MRKLERYPVQGANALWQLYKTVSFYKVLKNFIIIQIARYTPFLAWKNWLYKNLLHMEVGAYTAFALMVMVDLMFPERIKVGTNSVIGYNTTLLTHEYLIKEYRLGNIIIGNEVMIGANSTILPGVTIGDGATVAAGTIVAKDVDAGSFVAGNPMRVVFTAKEMLERKQEAE
ncbi:Acetyltransferase (isoleucine patch superfamily) [Amphibacillus marinus]|uniref:Acetyltransferase (Isoleucine patch superfamily) n=1 Tax=Amphibacillus marinus TaxID=872970 RepID=A0A1H8RS30_9BACI|nr:acyltransferase [Amphibacillus marinus]SEO69146.1 Acetyltransferase (isoleucine patch superfamily) [Amphibacillus marinus]